MLVILNLGSKNNRKWCTITLALHSHRLSRDPDKPHLNFFFELYSMRSGIWNRCWDTLRGWPLSANGLGSTRDGGKCRETDSFKYENDWCPGHREEFHGCQSQVEVLQRVSGNTECTLISTLARSSMASNTFRQSGGGKKQNKKYGL